jgi:hypothetical protein
MSSEEIGKTCKEVKGEGWRDKNVLLSPKLPII